MSTKGSVKEKQFRNQSIERCVRKSKQTRLFPKTKEKIMKTGPIHRTRMWKFKLKCCTMTLIPAAVGINYVASLGGGLKLPVWLGSLGAFLASMLAGPVCHCHQWFHQQRDLWSDLIANFNRNTLPASELLSEFYANGWFSSVRQYLFLLLSSPSFQLSFQRPQRCLGWSGRYRQGDSLFAVVANGLCGGLIYRWVLSWIFWICVAYLAFFIYRQLPKRMVHFFSSISDWSSTLISGVPQVKLKCCQSRPITLALVHLGHDVVELCQYEFIASGRINSCHNFSAIVIFQIEFYHL